MKLVFSNKQTILFIAIAIIIQNIACRKSQNSLKDEKDHNFCQKEFEAVRSSNCNYVGYKICSNDTICGIENNKSACLCRIFDANGKYIEYENCIRRYFILNGVCYYKPKQFEFHLCNYGWRGKNCEKKLLINDFKKQIKSNNKSRTFKSGKQIGHCTVTESNGITYSGECSEKKDVDNGVCFSIVNDKIKWRCFCFGDWNSTNECNQPICRDLGNCTNHGICVLFNGKRTCSCLGQWYTSDCSKECIVTPGHGYANFNSLSSECKIHCNPNYLLPDCEQENVIPPNPTDLTTKTLTTTEDTTQITMGPTSNFTVYPNIPVKVTSVSSTSSESDTTPKLSTEVIIIICVVVIAIVLIAIIIPIVVIKRSNRKASRMMARERQTLREILYKTQSSIKVAPDRHTRGTIKSTRYLSN